MKYKFYISLTDGEGELKVKNVPYLYMNTSSKNIE